MDTGASPPFHTRVSSAPPESASEDGFNIRSFGARGDGVHDNLPAYHAMVATINAKKGGTAYFPEGVYFMGRPPALQRARDRGWIGAARVQRPRRAEDLRVQDRPARQLPPHEAGRPAPPSAASASSGAGTSCSRGWRSTPRGPAHAARAGVGLRRHAHRAERALRQPGVPPVPQRARAAHRGVLAWIRTPARRAT